MKKLQVFLSAVFMLASMALAQSTMPDFTATDIDGNEHHLYTYLESGQHVLLEFFDLLANEGRRVAGDIGLRLAAERHVLSNERVRQSCR